jgi:iron complex outermembrane receptor protein
MLVTPVAAAQDLPAAPDGQRELVQTSETQTFSIAPQPLPSALDHFSEQTGISFAYTSNQLEGVQSPGVTGNLTPRQALTRLLAGTDVSFTFTDENTVTLAKASAQDGNGPIQLGPITVEGAAESAYGPVEGYRASRSATATRTDTPIMETPVSVQVVPEQVIEDQASPRLRDVYRNISGVQPAFTGFNVASTEVPITRGFQDSSIYRNGFRIFDVAPVELANIERVEVLKGPASVVYGLGEPGGLLNIVTKRPVNDTFTIVEQEFGSYDRYRTTVDANAPLTEDGSLLGRLNFAYTSDDTFRDHDGIDRVFVAPTLTYQPSDATLLTLDFSYSYEEYPFDHGVAFNADGEPVADISTFLGEPGFRSEREEIFAGYILTHDFSEQLTFRNVFSFQYLENRLNAFRHFGSTNADNTVDRTFHRSVPEATTFTTTADLGYEFDLGPTHHDVLVGVDLRWSPRFGNGNDGPRSRGPFPIDIINPQYGQFGTINFDNSVEFDEEVKWAGVYFQDQITLLNDRLHLLIGVRYDYVDQFVKFVTPTFNLEGDQTDSAFTGRVGALYELTDWLSPYISMAQSFNPTSPFTTSVDGLDPERGLAYEGGVKLSLFDGRLTSTLAGFQITKDNVPVTDPNNPDFSLNGGEQRSRGFEFDITGKLIPGWQVIANYAYTDTEVIESDTLPEGSRFLNVPLHSASLWSSYDFQPGSNLDGFGFSAGVRGVSDRLGDNAGTFDLDGFVVADTALWYRDTLDVNGYELPIRAQLNVQNLFDKEYYESSDSTANVFPGAPRTVIGTVSIGF